MKTDRIKRKRGLGSDKVSLAKRVEIATMGGKATPNKFTKDNAREMALKSWEVRRNNGK